MRAPSCWNLRGFSKNSLISWSSSTVSSMPATSAKVTLGASGETCLARLLAKPMTRLPPLPMRRIMKAKKTTISSSGKSRVSRLPHEVPPLLAVTATPGWAASSWASRVESG